MRVAHIIKATQIGGAERHLLILLKALRARDIDCHLIVIVEADNLMDNLVAEANAAAIPIERVVTHGNLDMALINRLRSRIRKIKPDIVHTHLIHADVFGFLAARLAFVPHIISTRHNDDSFRRNSFLRRFNRILWRGFSGGIAISEAVREFTIAVEGIKPNKLYLVHYGIEYQPMPSDIPAQARDILCQELNISKDTVIIGMACRLTKQKGVTYALQALARLPKSDNVHLVVAGDGQLMDALKRETQQLHLEGRVHFLGWREDASTLIAAWDIFLMPSLWEGFGLVLLEAMSKRVPVIGSNVSAIPEIVQHGQTGLLVPARNPDSLAQAIRMLVDDRALRAHMGLMAEDYLEQHFTVDRMADETIAVYNRIIGKK
jgi:glycosyltransferase involved in cell wall biosynthesis